MSNDLLEPRMIDGLPDAAANQDSLCRRQGRANLGPCSLLIARARDNTSVRNLEPVAYQLGVVVGRKRESVQGNETNRSFTGVPYQRHRQQPLFFYAVTSGCAVLLIPLILMREGFSRLLRPIQRVG